MSATNTKSILNIEYHFAKTQFGETVIATTEKGIVYQVFISSKKKAVEVVRGHFPNATLKESNKKIASSNSSAKLNLIGTDFQLKVWNELLKIPEGATRTYADIAKKIGNPKAVRAVGTAIGKNPIALLVPCHRVIQSSGAIGQYHWGIERKKKMLGVESVDFLFKKEKIPHRKG